MSGCTSIEGPAARRDGPSTEFLAIELAATIYNSGHIGRAFLIPSGDRTIVRIEASGVPDTVTRPIHLYTYIYEGTCVARSKKPAFALTETVLATSVAHPTAIGAFGGPLTISNAAPISLANPARGSPTRSSEDRAV